MDQNVVIAQIDVHIAVEMEEFDQIKGFLQFNKHVLNALVVEKKLLIHAMIVMDKGINNLQKRYQ